MCSSSSQALFLLVLSRLLLSCLASLNGVAHDSSWEPEYVLVGIAQNITANCESRYSVVFNGTSPGPVLHLEEGKTTWVRVYNEIPDKNLTVHWHGLSQRTAPFSDGTPLVSQWPIAPHHYFDYEIRPEVGDAGTYFYHSHVGYQAVTAHGLLVVNAAKGEEPPYKYDDDIPIFFSDYYQRNDSDIEAGLLANPFKWAGEPLAIGLNDRTGNASFSNATGDSCKPYVINVNPGKTYRLRFVSNTALSFVMVGIEGHSELTIIEADGRYTKPATTDHIQLGSGQRFSALLKTKTQEELDAEGKTSYWIRYENRDRPTNVSGYALLQYGCPESDSYPADLPTSPPVHLEQNRTEYTQWFEYTLEPYLKEDKDTFPKESEVTRTVHIRVNQVVVDGFYNGSVQGILQWDANNLTWSEATPQYPTPYLVAAYASGVIPNYTAAQVNNGWDPATRTFPAQVGEVIDIVWESNSGPTKGFDFHPMHAHGDHYWDLGSGPGLYNATENNAKFAKYTPAKRDTTQLYRYTVNSPEAFTTSGWRAWRIRVTEDNVGAWMMHCHVLAHMTMDKYPRVCVPPSNDLHFLFAKIADQIRMVLGMITVWVFGHAEEIVKEAPSPYVDGYLNYGGSAYGNDTYDPLVVEFMGS